MRVPTAHTRATRPVIAVQFWAWAALLRPLKHVLPLRMLVRLVRAGSRPRASSARPDRAAAILGYLAATGRFPARAPANCLERSLAGYRLLRSAGARPELCVGVRRVPAAGALDGHVWLVLDGTAVAERPEFIREFTVVVRVDADGRFESPGNAPAPAAEAELRSAP